MSVACKRLEVVEVDEPDGAQVRPAVYQDGLCHVTLTTAARHLVHAPAVRLHAAQAAQDAGQL